MYALNMLALDLTTDPAPHIYALGLSTKGLQQFLIDNFVVLLLVAAGLSALVNSLMGKHNAVVSVIGLSLISCGMIGIAIAPGAAVEVSKFMAGLIGVGGGG